MKAFPFARGPDTFCLVLPDACPDVVVHPFVSPWGETDEMLCLSNGVLLGLAVQSREGAHFVVSLAPCLDRRRPYPWAEPAEFSSALISLVGNIPEAIIRCERDTGQSPLEQLPDEEALSARLRTVLQYCVGRAGECPSFVYEKSSAFKAAPVRGA